MGVNPHNRKDEFALSKSISFTIDWISATFTDEGALSFVKYLKMEALPRTKHDKGRYGYDISQRYDNGVVAYWSSKEGSTGVHFVISGGVLSDMASKGVNLHSLLSAIRAAGGRTSRVDVAWDVIGFDLNWVGLGSPKRDNNGKGGRPLKQSLVTSDNDGWTMYVGSRQSERFLRVYNKTAESESDVKDWVRFEVEIKGEKAHAFGWHCGEGTISDMQAFARGMLKETCVFEHEVYTEIMKDEVKQMSLPKKSSRDTFGWLLKSVVPAIARLIAEKRDMGVWDEFCLAVERELRALGALSDE